MKKWPKLAAALLAVGALASCDSGTPITNEAALARMSQATESMSEAAGMKISSQASLSVTTKQDGMTSSVTMSESIDGEVMLTEGMPSSASLKVEISGGSTSSHVEEEGVTETSGSISSELYLYQGYLYGKSVSNTTANDVVEDPITEYIYIEFAELVGTITSMIDDLTGATTTTPLAAIEPDAGEEDESALMALLALISAPTLQTSGNRATITWKVTNDDIRAIVASIIYARTSADVTQLPSEIVAEIEAVIDELASIVDIKALELSITIVDETWISEMKVNVDVKIAIPHSEPAEALDIALKLNGNFTLEALAADHTITYPADMASWKELAEAE